MPIIAEILRQQSSLVAMMAEAVRFSIGLCSVFDSLNSCENWTDSEENPAPYTATSHCTPQFEAKELSSLTTFCDLMWSVASVRHPAVRVFAQ